MRYKDEVTRKLEQLDNYLQQLDHLMNVNDRTGVKEFVVMLKEKIEDIQTLINSED